MLDIMGVAVKDIRLNFGVRYIFKDKDNEIILDITEFTLDEFYKLSIEVGSLEEYNIINQFKDVKTIAGYDWSIKLGKDKPNLKKIFKTIELLGQRYDRFHKHSIAYYDYEDNRIHKHNKKWIEFMGYKLVSEGKTAIYYRENKYDI